MINLLFGFLSENFQKVLNSSNKIKKLNNVHDFGQFISKEMMRKLQQNNLFQQYSEILSNNIYLGKIFLKSDYLEPNYLIRSIIYSTIIDFIKDKTKSFKFPIEYENFSDETSNILKQQKSLLDALLYLSSSSRN